MSRGSSFSFPGRLVRITARLAGIEPHLAVMTTFLLLAGLTSGFLAMGGTLGCASSLAARGAVVSAELRGTPAGVVYTARSAIGSPYRWGGETPDGFDCSGLVQWVYARHGMRMPRTTRSQWTVGQAVGMADLRAGDIVFFLTDATGKYLHSGIYTGAGTFVHSPKSGGRVREDALREGYWRGSFMGARRVLR